MMEARLGWLLIGLFIGFVLGYFVRTLREIRDKVDLVDQHITHEKEDEGFTTPEWVKNVALFFVVALTAYSAFASQKASNKTNDNTETIRLGTTCNQQFVSKIISALNARTLYSQSQNAANVELQRAQSVFLGGLLKPPAGPRNTTQFDLNALATYFKALTNYTTLAGRSNVQVENNPYPTSKEFNNCLQGK